MTVTGAAMMQTMQPCFVGYPFQGKLMYFVVIFLHDNLMFLKKNIYILRFFTHFHFDMQKKLNHADMH